MFFFLQMTEVFDFFTKAVRNAFKAKAIVGRNSITDIIDRRGSISNDANISNAIEVDSFTSLNSVCAEIVPTTPRNKFFNKVCF
uniref:Uncharacterized protein n=1 Tax=Panagrolaimus superbus TaxID=310955 RepID=A0A914XV51_9BILA